MRKPIDYPKNTNSVKKTKKSGSITFGELRHRVNARKPVTDDMIDSARKQLETAYMQTSGTNKESSNSAIARFKKRFR